MLIRNTILHVQQQKCFDISPGRLSQWPVSYTPGMLRATSYLSLTFDKDPIRNWISGLIYEDTTYFGYKSNLNFVPVSDKFMGDRVNRWIFAWQIYSDEYNLRQKLFGGGFNFLNWYGYYFLKDKTSL